MAPEPELVAKISGVNVAADTGDEVLVGDQVTVWACEENVKTTSVNPALSFAVAPAIARTVHDPTANAVTIPVELFTEQKASPDAETV
jgi:hypothetical protein